MSEDNKMSETDKIEDDQVKVKLMIGEKEYELNEAFVNECIKEDEGTYGLDSLAKTELAKIGLRTFTRLLAENANLKSQVKSLTKELFDSNSNAVILRKEFDEYKIKHEDPVPTTIDFAQFNTILKKLEDIHEVQVKCEPLLNDLNKVSNENKINIERAVGIIGARNKADKEKKLTCKVNMFRALEDSTKTITIFGTESALIGFRSSSMFGDMRRDMETLVQRNIIVIEGTDKTGMDNLVQLVSENVAEKKEGSSAVVLLNFAAETAVCLLADEKMCSNNAKSAEMYLTKVNSILKEKYDKVIFVLPASTKQSELLNKKVADSIKNIDENEVEVLNMTSVQKDFDLKATSDEVFENVEKEKLLQKFIAKEGNEKEGWNTYASNVLMSKVLESIVEIQLKICPNCGVIHDEKSCFSEDKRAELEAKERLDNHNKERKNGNDWESCLRCFGYHETANCRISKDLLCSFNDCNGIGHKKKIHYPQKSDTVTRLKDKYGPTFKILQGNASVSEKVTNSRKRTNNSSDDRSSSKREKHT